MHRRGTPRLWTCAGTGRPPWPCSCCATGTAGSVHRTQHA